MTASAFDLLRGTQRRSRQPIFDASVGAVSSVASPGPKGSTDGGDLFGQVDQHLRLPLKASAVSVDEPSGLWWTVESHRVLYFPLLGQQWPPLGVHLLPKDAAVDPHCIALLSGPGHNSHGSLRDRGCSNASAPSAVAVLSDMRISVFPEGASVHLPRPSDVPMGQVPKQVAIACTHPAPGVLGVVLIVLTTSGRLFSIFLEECGGSYSATASPLWPTSCQSGLNRWFSRIRNAFPGGGDVDASSAQCASVHGVEVMPAPQGVDAAFAVLAWDTDRIAMYIHSADVKGAELAWVLPVSQLIATPQASLLTVRISKDGDGELLMLYESASSQKTMLARSSWPSLSIRESPRAVAGPAAEATVGPTSWKAAPGQDVGSGPLFSIAAGVLVSAVPIGERRCVLATTYASGAGLRVEDSPPVDMPILGLALLPLASANFSPQRNVVAVLTPHGLLDCPLSSSGPADSLGATGDIVSSVKHAFELFAGGQEEKAKAVMQHVIRPGTEVDLCDAISTRTRTIIDAPTDSSSSRWQGVSSDVITRYALFDKARDMQQWLRFLAGAGVWTRLGISAKDMQVRQGVVEACEKLFVATRLRELDDRHPQVFAGAIHRAVQDLGQSAPGSEACALYGNVSTCDRLLQGLVSYARSLPLGSADVVEAVILIDDIVVNFLEAAMDQRDQLLNLFPTLLPPPPNNEIASRRILEGSAQQPRGVGSSWLVSPSMLHTLEDIRLLNIKVMAPPEVRHFALLDAQSLRIVEGLRDVCRSTLRAAHASLCALHGDEFGHIRRAVLQHLMDAEASLSTPTSSDDCRPRASCCRSLLLAEEFEDLDTIVTLLASDDPARLDSMMEKSPEFRRHALGFFLRTSTLQPLFFRSIRQFPLPSSQLEELLDRYPELRWTLEMQSVPSSSSDADWNQALERVGRRATSSLQKEAHSAARRDMFAALAVIAKAAAPSSGAVPSESSSSKSQGLDSVVADLACLGRLQRTIRQFQAFVPVGSKRPSPSEAPASAEDLLTGLGDCVKTVLGVLREEGRSGQLMQDAAHLLYLFERSLAERGIQYESPDGSAKDAVSARAAQRLCSEIILADIAVWQDALKSRQGAVPVGSGASTLSAQLADTGFYKMLASRAMRGAALPESANVDKLCDAFPELQCLKPVLREVSLAAAEWAAK